MKKLLDKFICVLYYNIRVSNKISLFITFVFKYFLIKSKLQEIFSYKKIFLLTIYWINVLFNKCFINTYYKLISFYYLNILSKLYFRLFSEKITFRNFASLLLAGMHSALVAFQFKYLRLDWVLWSIACHNVYHAHSANPVHDRICTESHDERCLFVSNFCQEARRLTLLPDSPFPILSLSLYFPLLGRTVRRQP